MCVGRFSLPSCSSEHILTTMAHRHASDSRQPAISAQARRSESSASAILDHVRAPETRSGMQARSFAWQYIAAR